MYEFVAADRTMVAAGAGYSFRSYTDKSGVVTNNPGSVVIYDDGTKDKMGRPVGKGFSINQSHYKLMARDGQKDYNDLPLFTFFLNAPFCEGSPNGDYTDTEGNEVPVEDLLDRKSNLKRIKEGQITQHNVKIKLLETELDAKIAVDTATKRAEAQISVVQIDEQTMSEVAAMIGIFGKPDMIMKHKLLEFAGKRPLDYFKYLNSGDRGVRALIRKAISSGILTKKGELIYWEETVVGQSEDAAVAALLSDKDMMSSLQSKVDLKIEKKSATKKK